MGSRGMGDGSNEIMTAPAHGHDARRDHRRIAGRGLASHQGSGVVAPDLWQLRAAAKCSAPRSTPALLAELRRWKYHAIMLLRYQARTVPCGKRPPGV